MYDSQDYVTPYNPLPNYVFSNELGGILNNPRNLGPKPKGQGNGQGSGGNSIDNLWSEYLKGGAASGSGGGQGGGSGGTGGTGNRKVVVDQFGNPIPQNEQRTADQIRRNPYNITPGNAIDPNLTFANATLSKANKGFSRATNDIYGGGAAY